MMSAAPHAGRRAAAWGLGVAVLLLATSALADEAIPYRTASVLTGARLVRMGLGLCLSVALVWGVLQVIRRYFPSIGEAASAGGRIEVLETRALSPNQALMLVRVDDRSLLLSRTKEGLSTLADLGSDVAANAVAEDASKVGPERPLTALTALFPRTGSDSG